MACLLRNTAFEQCLLPKGFEIITVNIRIREPQTVTLPLYIKLRESEDICVNWVEVGVCVVVGRAPRRGLHFLIWRSILIDLLNFKKIATSYFIEPAGLNYSALSLTPRRSLFIKSALENHFPAKKFRFCKNIPTSKASGSARSVEDNQITSSRPIIQLGTWV